MKTIFNKVLMAVMLSLVLSSCGLFKRTTKTDTVVKAKASDSSHVAIQKVDSSAKSRTVVKETIDTAVTIKGSTQEGSKDLDALKRGDSLVLDDEDQRTVVEYDHELQRLRARSTVKDRKQPVQLNRETVHESDVSIERQASQATRVTKSEVDASQRKETNTKTRVGPDWSMWAGLYIAIGMGLLLILVFWKRKFGRWFS